MLRIAERDGIATIVATPHSHHARAEAVLHGVERLNRVAHAQGIAVAVVPGHEVRIGPGIVERQRDGRVLTLNGGPWLLIELYLHDEWPLRLVERALDRLLDAGLSPLLAHVERYPFVQRDSSALLPLIERGIPMQVNASAFGYREQDVERVTAERLLKSRMAHVIASDAHNPGYRPPRLRPALAAAEALCGAEHVRWMLDAAETIVAGGALSLPEPWQGDAHVQPD